MKKLLFIFFVALIASAIPSRLAAQGEDNPTGVTGIYNGNVTSGCSYDPYTENALRVVDDIVVPGCVGAYPLKWTRYNNSRHEGVGYDGWSFSYAYALDAAALIATFPDGRIISWWDPPVDPAVEEHIGIWNGYEAIFLGDGGKAVFNETTPGATNFLVTSLVDPYGNRTAISYDIVAYTPQGDPIYQRSRITEPGGRYLQLTWNSVLPVYNRQITGVQAFDGRGNLIETVNYVGGSITNGTETFTTLAGANYDDGTSCSYTYEIIGGTNSHRPAIVTADDVRNPSPLRQIMYNHVAGGKGGIGWEKKPSGELLSSITYTGANTRTETRGDNATRTFIYGNRAGGAHQMGKLIDYSDFAGHHTTLGYESNMWSLAYGFLTTVTDANNHTTTYTRSTASWAIMKITFPDTSFIEQTFTDEANPYYLASRTARRGPGDPAHITTYTRDANHRITRKDYPDGAFEEFFYNSFGQVLDHHMTSGGWEHFAYDPRGLKTSYTDALGNVTIYSYYSPGDANFPAWCDRLKTVTHPANISGFQQTETYEYDRTFVNGVDTGAPCGGRGLVTKVTHTDGSTITTTHNKWGDVLTATDELVHTTTNTYDDYGRLLTTADPLNHTTTNSYIPSGQTNSYVTNSKLPWSTTLPSGKQTKTYYDPNWRKTRVQQAPGTGDEANSYFTYDNVGNLLTAKDPRNNITTNHYDVCDRVDSVTAPAPFNYVTTFEYYLTGLKKKETPPNGGWTSFDSYDGMNRLTQKTHHRDATTNDLTTVQYDSAGNLWKSWDERSNLYQYTYDLMNRRLSMIYPDTAQHEDTAYDFAGNVNTYTNRNGKIQTFRYDNRNRQTFFSWNDGTTLYQSTYYDAASRVTLLSNLRATINYTYYNDNRLNTQDESLYGFSSNGKIHRIITYTYDADGNRATIQYPSGTAFNYIYSNRNQLASIQPGLSGGAPIVSYTYDSGGNIIHATRDNGTSSDYTLDAANRETAVVHTFVGSTKRFDYAYNNVHDITVVQRDSGLGDGYKYDLTQEVTEYQQDGTVDFGSGTVTYPAADNNMTFDGCGNRTVLNGVNQSFNTMNQPIGGSFNHDAQGNLSTYNGWTYTYDAQNRLTRATNGTATVDFYYDGRNRQVARSINGVFIFSIWDDWELVEEYTGTVRTSTYLQGAHGPVKSLLNNVYYYQDSLGSTSHIADSSGGLLEYYKYNLYGTPTYWNASGTQISPTANTPRDLFSGERWIPEMSMYDLRNRYYSPDLGRFLQPDPISFKGDSSNLYRYCGNDWANRTDPMGLIPDGPVTPEERDAMNESYTAIGRFVGHQIAEAYRENPVDFIIFLATMGRAPKGMRFSPEGFRGRIPTSIPERIASTQTTVGGQFRTGEFTNVPLSQVVTGLRNGTIKPNQVPVSIIKRDGQWYTLNNRSLKALKQAGMQPSKVIDATGDPRAEKLLTRRLNEFKDKMGELPTSEFDPPARKIPATAGEEAK